MLDFEKASKIIEDHFTNLTDEEFIINLKEYCPRVFEEEDLDKNDPSKHSNRKNQIINQSSDNSK